MKREECIKMLRDNDVFKSVLGQARDDKERRYIKAYAEDFVFKFYDGVYAPIAKMAETDPEALRQALTDVYEEVSKPKTSDSGNGADK